MAQGHLKWNQNELTMKKTGCKKSRETVTLSTVPTNIHINYLYVGLCTLSTVQKCLMFWRLTTKTVRYLFYKRTNTCSELEFSNFKEIFRIRVTQNPVLYVGFHQDFQLS